MQAFGAQALVVEQTCDQLGRRCLQETGCELVQQAADFVGTVIEQRRFARVTFAQRLRACQGMLKQPGQVRQIGKAHRGRVARQRMGQRHGRVANGLVQLVRPLGQLGAQAARLLVGLVQENVEQWDADTQGADHLVRFRLGLGLGLRCQRRRGWQGDSLGHGGRLRLGH